MKKEYIDDLIGEAICARKRAYARYSDFMVGAALMAENVSGERRVFTGCNIENASYGASICAERCAAAKAVSEGFVRFDAIAVVGGLNKSGITGKTYPCGICRQFLSEFGSDMEVIVAEGRDDFELYKLSELIPCGFALDAGIMEAEHQK